MNFTLESYFNPHMTIGSTRLDAIISVSANNDNLSEMAVGGKKAVGFVIDTSGSMDGEKIAQGKSTLRKCIQSLDEECYFFIISFCHTSDVIVPMTLATPKAKKKCRRSY